MSLTATVILAWLLGLAVVVVDCLRIWKQERDYGLFRIIVVWLLAFLVFMAILTVQNNF